MSDLNNELKKIAKEWDEIGREWEDMLGPDEDDLGGRETTRILNQDEIDSLLGFGGPVPLSFDFDFNVREFWIGCRYYSNFHQIAIQIIPCFCLTINLPHED